MIEFYEVMFDWGETHYFRDKEKAFEFAKQSYLNDATLSTGTEKGLNKDLHNLNEMYFIDNFVYINVKEFED